MPIGSGFVNLENILALNQSKGKQMRDKLQEDSQLGMGAQASKFLGGTPQGSQYGSDVAKKQKLLGTEGGVMQGLQNAYGRGEQGYNTSQSAFDAAVSGGPIKKPVQPQGIFNTLDSYQKGRGQIGGMGQTKPVVQANPIQAAVTRAQNSAATNGKVDTKIDESDQVRAQEDGVYEEWIKAGRPPYAQWRSGSGL